MNHESSTAVVVWRGDDLELAMGALGDPVPMGFVNSVLASWEEIVSRRLGEATSDGPGHLGIFLSQDEKITLGVRFAEDALSSRDRWLRFEAAHVEGEGVTTAAITITRRALVELPKDDMLVPEMGKIIGAIRSELLCKGSPCVV